MNDPAFQLAGLLPLSLLIPSSVDSHDRQLSRSERGFLKQGEQVYYDVSFDQIRSRNSYDEKFFLLAVR